MCGRYVSPYDAGLMAAYEVGTQVNSPKNNAPSNIDPRPLG
jgi:putative SOS response-associated peptidase YedK